MRVKPVLAPTTEILHTAQSYLRLREETCPMNISRIPIPLCALICLALPLLASAQSSEPFIGHWALTIPGGKARDQVLTKT